MSEPESLQDLIVSVYRLHAAAGLNDREALENLPSAQHHCLEVAVHRLPRDLYLGLWYWMIDLNTQLLETRP